MQEQTRKPDFDNPYQNDEQIHYKETFNQYLIHQAEHGGYKNKREAFKAITNEFQEYLTLSKTMSHYYDLKKKGYGDQALKSNLGKRKKKKSKKYEQVKEKDVETVTIKAGNPDNDKRIRLIQGILNIRGKIQVHNDLLREILYATDLVETKGGDATVKDILGQ